MILYHGTRFLDLIISDDCIKCPIMGDLHVSLTTSFEVAYKWASMERDGCSPMPPHSETVEVGGIIAFKRKTLLDAGYRLFLFDGTGEDDEAEIACLSDIPDIKSTAFSLLKICEGVGHEL